MALVLSVVAARKVGVDMRPWVCNFFQKARRTDTVCGVCGQTKEAHLERDRRRGGGV